MKHLIGIVAVIAAFTLCFLCIGCSQGSGASSSNAITVSATGAAEIEPDEAAITILSRAEGANEEEVRANGNRVANDIVARIKTAGVAEEAITLTPGELSPVYGGIVEEQIPYGYYDWDGNWIEEGGYDTVYYDLTGEIVGYEMATTIAIAAVDAEVLPTVLKEAAAAGATGFDNLSFRIGDRESAYQLALTAAVDAAHAKAEALAAASKVYVGRVVNMVEDSDAASIVITKAGDAKALNPADLSTLDIAISPIAVEAAVTVSYAIS